jgi:hypothetical protein
LANNICLWAARREYDASAQIQLAIQHVIPIDKTCNKAENYRAARAIWPRHRSHGQFEEALISGAPRF